MEKLSSHCSLFIKSIKYFYIIITIFIMAYFLSIQETNSFVIINSTNINYNNNNNNNNNNPLMTLLNVSSTLATNITKSSSSLDETVSTTSFVDFNTSQLHFDTGPIQGWRCYCWNTTNGLEEELECRCEGSALLRIPQRLHLGMQRLTISVAGLKLLRAVGLKVYASSLRDVMLTDLLEFDAIESGAFSHLTKLRTIYISHAPKLKWLSADVFYGISSTFRSLRILYCGLLAVPDLRYLSTGIILHMVDLEGNQITKIDENAFHIKTELLIFDNNALTYINKSAFLGSEIAKLSFKGNQKLKYIHELAFMGLLNILELDLSSTSLEALPAEGLQDLEILRIQNTHSLKTVPSVYNFKNLRIAWLTHSFHCCAFKYPSRHDPFEHSKRQQYLEELQRTCISKGFLSDVQISSNSFIKLKSDTINTQTETIRNSSEEQYLDTEMWFDVTQIEDGDVRVKRLTYGSNSNEQFMKDPYVSHFEDAIIQNQNESIYLEIEDGSFINPITGAPYDIQNRNNFDDFSHFINHNQDFGEFHQTTADVSANSMMNAICGNLSKNKIDIQCYPIPDALNPCEDVMGAQWLRISVWIVVFLAVFGNMAVLIVLFSNWKDLTVPKFLMCHLAFADLCLGLYLLLIAAIDIHSMGEYFNFAFDWQYGSGCKAAGFLTVFASNLSVFTLTIITLERWYAITNAINLNKRIKLRTALVIMICGWIYSIFMSALPLFGVSNYSSTSICLPMEARDSFDISYLVTIIAINGFAFFFIAICYGQIYFSLGKNTRQSCRNATRGEMTVAKKMALLVFTNFACWAPIAFFGLTALGGIPLIDVAKSKILLVFFYPLNSCADPYLYAILTTQYRRDLYILLSRYGFCKQKAQQYKMNNYSLPTNNTYQIPMIRRGSSISGGRGNSGTTANGGANHGGVGNSTINGNHRRPSDICNEEEEFV